MSLWTRIRLLLNTEASSALDQAEDPRHVLDYAYNQQQELLITLRRGLVDVATAKQQLEQQAQRLESRIPHLDDHARRPVAAGRHDLAPGAREGDRLAGRPRGVSRGRWRRLRGGRAAPHHPLQGDRRPAREDQVRGGEQVMSTTKWNPGSHLVSPDGKWYWDGVSQEWKPVAQPAPKAEASLTPPTAPTPTAKGRGLDSFVGTIRSEDLASGQTVLVWARWILIGTGLLLSFWTPKDLLTLQVQLAAIIALAFGNFYLHVQLLRGRPALDNVVYGASIADICVVTALVLVQGGYPSPVFIFYFAAIVGISVAFPTVVTAGYTAIVVGVYGLISLATATTDEYPAVFIRLLTIAAVAVCGNLFARHEAERRADAIRRHTEMLDEIEQQSSTGGQPDVEHS